MVVSAIEARFRRIFMRIIAILPGFSDFPEKNFHFFIQKRILRVKFLHIPDLFSFYKQMAFSAIEARFRRIFFANNCSFARFSNFFQQFKDKAPI